MCERWIFTVPREMNMRSPISGFVRPAAAWRTISSSVGVRLSQPAGRPLARSASAAHVCDRLIERQRFALAASVRQRVVAERFTQPLRERFRALLLGLPARKPEFGARAAGGAQQARGLLVALQSGRDLGEDVERIRNVEVVAALGLVCEGLMRQVLGGGPVPADSGDARELMARACHQPAVADALGDRERLLGRGLSGGVVAAEAFHLRQVYQRHRLGPDEPAGVLLALRR